MSGPRASTSYWQQQLSRRRVIRGAALGGAGLAGAALIGCGGSGTDNKGTTDTGAAVPGDKSGLLAKPVDTTDRVVPGGIFQSVASTDITHFDSLAATDFQSATWTAGVYSLLVKFKTAKSPDRADGSLEGDAATSWEVAPDGQQVTLKLRPNMPFDPRPPTNSRLLDSQDVKFSWEKYSTKSNARSDMNHAINAQAPIDSFQTPDSSTVVVKLAFPYAPAVSMLAFSRYVQIQPREADGGFDARRDVRGTGAWTLSSYTPSVGFSYRRNPNWYAKPRPFLDGTDYPILPEYATQLAQLIAGNIWSGVARQEDILATKRDHMDMELRQAATFPRTPGAVMYFGFNAGSPFLDDRVRKAASMLMDRQLYLDTVYNVQPFKDAGLDVPSRWHSHIACGEEAAWLDPQGKGLGQDAQNFQLNPAEAKKLMAAAGYTKPLEVDYTMFTSGQYGATWPRYNEIWMGMLQEGGLFKLKTNVVDYQTVWLPQYLYGYSAGTKPGFNGITATLTTTFPDVDGYMFAMDHSKGQYIRRTEAMYDAKMDSIIESQRREFDRNKRVDLHKEYQRYAASKMYDFPISGAALSFGLNWPWVGNSGVYNTWSVQDATTQTTGTYTWYDKSKAKS